MFSSTLHNKAAVLDLSTRKHFAVTLEFVYFTRMAQIIGN